MAFQTAKVLTKYFNFDIIVAYRSTYYEEDSEFYDSNILHLILPNDNASALTALIKKFPFDIIHLFDFVNSDFIKITKILSHKVKSPLIVTPASDYNLWEDKFGAKELMIMSDAVISLTPNENVFLKNLIGSPSSKVLNVRHGINLPLKTEFNFRSYLKIPEDAPIVLFIGRKLQTKGFELLLEASKCVWHFDQSVRFIFLGPNTPESVNTFSVYKDKRIIDLGMVEEHIKKSALETCNIFCLPSTVDVFPLVFLEAWSFGKPVIGSRSSGIEHVIQDNKDGLIVEPNKVSLSSSIIKLLKHDDFSKSLGKSGLEKITKDHSWQIISKQLMQIYLDCISEKESVL